MPFMSNKEIAKDLLVRVTSSRALASDEGFSVALIERALEAAEKRGRENVSGRRFPLQVGKEGGLRSMPWAMLAPQEAQALANHGQSLEKLAARGGLSAKEAMCVLDGIELRGTFGRSPADRTAHTDLRARVEKWEALEHDLALARILTLGDALGKVLARLGVTDDEAPLTGPQLLLAAGTWLGHTEPFFVIRDEDENALSYDEQTNGAPLHWLDRFAPERVIRFKSDGEAWRNIDELRKDGSSVWGPPEPMKSARAVRVTHVPARLRFEDVPRG